MKKAIKFNLLTTTALSVALLGAAQAHAADAAAPAPAPAAEPASDEIDAIVVTGFRDSLMHARDLKRKAVGAVDVIVSEDIAAFPDLNLAELEAWLAGGAGRTAAFGLMRDTQRDTALLEAAERVCTAPVARRSRLGLIAAGAAMVAGLSAVVLVRPFLASVEKPVEFATPLGRRAEHQLSDKSVVTLAADSGVSVRYSRGAREIALTKGDAVFDVTKDAKRPFRVQAGDTQVTAVGTTFEVELVSDAVQVRAFDSVVRVNRDGAERRVGKGEWLMLASNRAPVAGRLEADSYEAWRSDWLDADGLPLKYVIARLNRYTTQSVAVHDPGLGELKVTIPAKAGIQAGSRDGARPSDDPLTRLGSPLSRGWSVMGETWR